MYIKRQTLTLKVPITTAAEDKLSDTFPHFRKKKVWYFMRIVCQSDLGLGYLSMATSVRNFRTFTVCVSDLSLQRVKERKTYLDQDIDDDDIEGKRSYNLDEKLASTKHNKDYVTTGLRGEGEAYLV